MTGPPTAPQAALEPADAARIEALRAGGAATGAFAATQEAAWAALPAPRHGWGYHSQSIAGALFRAALAAGALDAAAHWLGARRAAAPDPNDPGLALDGAELALARGDRQAAAATLAALFKAFGKRPFAGRRRDLLALLTEAPP